MNYEHKMLLLRSEHNINVGGRSVETAISKFSDHSVLLTIPGPYILWYHLGRVKRIWYLSPMRAAKVQASLRIHAVWPEPPLLTHTSIESRGTFRQKARSLAPLNGWACAVKIVMTECSKTQIRLMGPMYLNALAADSQIAWATAFG